MDRDVALQILSTAVAIKTAVQAIAANTSPEEPVGMVGASPDRSLEDVPEEPEEPVTRNKK